MKKETVYIKILKHALEGAGYVVLPRYELLSLQMNACTDQYCIIHAPQTVEHECVDCPALATAEEVSEALTRWLKESEG